MAGIISVLTKTPFLLNELRKVLPDVVFANIGVPESDLQFKQSNVIIADFDLLGPYIYNLPNAKWVQGTWAGIDALVPFITKGEPSYPISRFSGNAFGTLMSEYVLANIVNYERDFFTIMNNQRQKKWDLNGRISNYRSISDLTIGIMGLGNIGTKIGKQLHNFGGTILAYGRQPKIDKFQFDFIDEYFTNNTIHELLEKCDYLINILPKTKETIGLLNGDTLKHCKERGTVFINIGRGSIISEKDLIKALNEKWIQAAILDVFENEPLSKESLLWNMSNIFITPHVSGQSRAKDIAEQFKKNFEQFSHSVMSFPSKEERAKCWNARDHYWECLDKNKKNETVCDQFRKLYESSCTAQWVKHFDRKRNYLQFKEKIEKDGIPYEQKSGKTFNQKRRVYEKIACV